MSDNSNLSKDQSEIIETIGDYCIISVRLLDDLIKVGNSDLHRYVWELFDFGLVDIVHCYGFILFNLTPLGTEIYEGIKRSKRGVLSDMGKRLRYI